MHFITPQFPPLQGPKAGEPISVEISEGHTIQGTYLRPTFLGLHAFKDALGVPQVASANMIQRQQVATP